jgi:hypothetical protein
MPRSIAAQEYSLRSSPLKGPLGKYEIWHWLIVFSSKGELLVSVQWWWKIPAGVASNALNNTHLMFDTITNAILIYEAISELAVLKHYTTITEARSP